MEQEFSEFRESDKLLKHELKPILIFCLSHVSCWLRSTILVSNTRGGRFEHFYSKITNIFVIEFSEISVNI